MNHNYRTRNQTYLGFFSEILLNNFAFQVVNAQCKFNVVFDFDFFLNLSKNEKNDKFCFDLLELIFM